MRSSSRSYVLSAAVVAALASLPARTARADEPAPAAQSEQRAPALWTASATAGVVTLPRPLSFEALVAKRRASDPRYLHFGFGAGVEYLPAGLAQFGPKTDFSWLQVGVDGRWFPWRWVFVGARLGWQSSRTDSEKFGSEVDYITTSLFFAPRAGILHAFSNGVTIGGDLGASIPFAGDTKLESDGTEDSGARKASKTFGLFTMPFVSLFRVGYTL